MYNMREEGGVEMEGRVNLCTVWRWKWEEVEVEGRCGRKEVEGRRSKWKKGGGRNDVEERGW